MDSPTGKPTPPARASRTPPDPAKGKYLQLKQHISSLRVSSVAIHVPSFASAHAPNTCLHRAIADTLAECIAAEEFESRNQPRTGPRRPARAILLVVASEHRALAVMQALRPLMPAHITTVRLTADSGSRDLQEKDLAVVLVSHALRLFEEERIAMTQFCKLVFDEAQHAGAKTHPYAEIMRDFYGWLGNRLRPQVLAIATGDAAKVKASAVEENLFTEFAVEGSSTMWRFDPKVVEVEDTLACVEEVKHGTFGPRTRQTLREDVPAFDILKSEVGHAGVSLYERLFAKREMLREFGDDAACRNIDHLQLERLKMSTITQGLTEKTKHLLHILERAWSSATSTDERAMSAIVYVDRPVVAVGLLAVIRSLPCFQGMKAEVILGDQSAAKPLQRAKLATGGRGQPRLPATDGWQGDETDDECLDQFGSGDSNVLIVANDNIRRITRCRRPIAPAPLVIRFDGSTVDLDHDGGGGHCRILVFKEDFSRRRSNIDARHQRGKRMRPVVDAPVKVEAVKEDEPMSLCDEEPRTPAVGKKRQRSPQLTPSGNNSASPRNVRRGRNHRQDDEIAIAHTVKIADALVGPQKDGAGDYFLYRFRLPDVASIFEESGGKTGVSLFKKYFTNAYDADVSDAKAAKAGGLETFGIVLSRRLNGRDLDVSLGSLGLQTHVSDDVGSLRLDFAGKINLTSANVSAARKFMMKLFSLLMEEAHTSFNWEGYLSKDTSNTPKEKEYYRQYLVVPLQSNDKIDWFKVYAAESKEAGQDGLISARPTPSESLSEHIESLQFNLLQVLGRQGIALAGTVRIDQSPLTYLLRSRRFLLNEDGSFKPHKHIHRLIYTKENPDETEKCPDLPCNNEDPLQDPRDIKTQHALRRCPMALFNSKGEKETYLFSPSRNRAKEPKRETWIGKFNQTYQEYRNEINQVDVQFLSQPLITTMQIPRFDFAQLISALKGSPMKTIVEDVMNSLLANSKSRVPTSSDVPELCRPHPISAGAMLLPPLLLSLERHALLCELRDLFASKIKIPMQLKWFAMAVTPNSVNEKNCYERLEFLGDSVLKLSCTLRMFVQHPHASEGNMHFMRANQVSNETLRVHAHKHNLEKYLCFEREQVDSWRAPGCDRVGRTVLLNQKALADVTEALCGVMYVSGLEDYNRQQHSGADDDLTLSRLSSGGVVEGYKCGTKMLELLKILPGTEPSMLERKLAMIHSLHKRGTEAPTKVCKEALPRDRRVTHPGPGKSWKDVYGPLEEKLGYRFHCRHFLICALTHGSFVDQNTSGSTMSHTFQRLEFLGDAVLDFCIVAYLYDKYPLLGPGDLTDLKGMTVSNESFARVTIQWGLDEYLFIDSAVLKQQIAHFRDEMAKNDTNDVDLVGCTSAPKVLGDILESIVGAVLVDKGLERAYNVAMKLMKKTLETTALPERLKEHPSRRLVAFLQGHLGLKNVKPMLTTKMCRPGRANGRSVVRRIGHQSSATENMFRCTVRIIGEEVSSEEATSKVRAELIAARVAFRRLSNPKLDERTAKLIAAIKIKANKLAAETLRHCRR